jgi:biopolymer transport protein ExbB/TolQ
MSPSPRRHRVLLISTVVAGVIMILAPVIGLLGTVAGMSGAFVQLKSSGSSDPEKLSGAIGTVLKSTAGGLLVSAVAFVVFVILLILTVRESRKRAALPLTSLPQNVSS